MAGFAYALIRGVVIGYFLVALLYRTMIYIIATPVSLAVLSLFGFKFSSSISGVSSNTTPRIDLAAHARRVLEARQHSQVTSDLDLADVSSWSFESSEISST